VAFIGDDLLQALDAVVGKDRDAVLAETRRQPSSANMYQPLCFSAERGRHSGCRR
jgi:hypothetical protein